MQAPETSGPGASAAPEQLAGGLRAIDIFVFLWACQALVHQHVYRGWLVHGESMGWVVTLAALGLLMNPRSMLLFATLLASSIVHNVSRWPFVVNHILVEAIISATMLLALATVAFPHWRARGKLEPLGPGARQRVYVSFAPVVRVSLICVYFFAFVAKLNWDFLDVEVSCTSVMYEDLLRVAPFVPDTQWARVTSIWATVAIEFLLPVLLSFRKTRSTAVAIGLPFHLMLGAIGHYTFSALVYALYFLFVDRDFVDVVNNWRERIGRLVGSERVAPLFDVARAGAVLGMALLIGLVMAGEFRGSWAVPRMIWFLWSLTMIAIYAEAILRSWFVPRSAEEVSARMTPAWLWLIPGLVILNGLSQYVGLKTKSSFTMYSNLRTEAGQNNHLFVPSFLKVAGFQEDVVDVVSADHAAFKEISEQDLLLPYFEFRRIVSGLEEDAAITYLRNGEKHVYVRKNGVGSDPELARKPAKILAMLLYFRPVSKGTRMQCRH